MLPTIAQIVDQCDFNRKVKGVCICLSSSAGEGHRGSGRLASQGAALDELVKVVRNGVVLAI